TFRAAGIPTAIFTPWPVSTFTEVFSKDKANEYFSEGKAVFFAGGTGHPYFSTDTGVVLRAMEMNADLILAAKNIDGVYDKDPGKNPDAKKFKEISIHEVVERKLGVIDLTASALLDEHQIPMRIFALKEKDSIVKALGNRFNGTDVVVDPK
ncbi:MAG: UMP kinase, partial [Parasporobacterium sp.]|nr:UMP kinase [Parasporobacterium sp.]